MGENLAAEWKVQGKLKTTGGKHPVVLIPQPSNNPDDPLNWSAVKKYRTLAVLCFAGFAALGLPASQQLSYYAQTSTYPGRTTVELSYSVTACVVGLVCGPLLIAPWAKVVGRTSLMFWTLIGAALCQIWAAQMTGPNDYVPFILSRAIAGLFASVPTILGPSYAVEIFFLHQRGKIFTAFELSFLLGVNVSPTVGGFIVQYNPWPVSFYWTLAPAGLAILLVFLFLEETGGYSKTSESAARPIRSKSFWQNRFDTFLPGTRVVPRTSLKDVIHYAKRPLVISAAPITIIAGGYIFIAFAFVILTNIILTIILESPEDEGGYGFTPKRNAEFTLTAWVAIFAAQLIGTIVGDRVPLWLTRRLSGGVWRPENRLFNILLPGVVAPIALGIFGAAVEYHLHYLVLALGFFLITFSSMLAVPICLNYVVECFMSDAMEASIAMNTWRMTFAVFTGFIFGPWKSAVGVGWMFGMAAFFDLLALLAIMILIWKGQYLRQHSFGAESENGARVVDEQSATPSGSDLDLGSSSIDSVTAEAKCDLV